LNSPPENGLSICCTRCKNFVEEAYGIIQTE
jgi:hypothetical protein